MNRRNFIKNTVGILIASPAIVKAENIMPLWVPSNNIERMISDIIDSVPVGYLDSLNEIASAPQFSNHITSMELNIVLNK